MTKYYILGMNVYKTIKDNIYSKSYIFGIKIRQKIRTKHFNVHILRVNLAEQKILTLGLYYKDLPKEKRHILLFDQLADPYAEAIDSWTFFQYLQKNNIPSKYVLLRKNKLFTKLESTHQLKDILPVNNELDFLERYADEIAKSHTIINSFGFFTGNNIFKQLPHIKYIFIEHGVSLLNEWALSYYSDNSNQAADKVLVPTRKTKELYDTLSLWKDKMYCCGFPRWDNLPLSRKNQNERNIFIFFTMRATFRSDSTQKPEYLKRIQDFIDKLSIIAGSDEKIKIFIAPHHDLLNNDASFDFSSFKNVNIVSSYGISDLIKKTDLLITDFSSICFDLIYMNVPVIFYYFDIDITYQHPRDVSCKKVPQNIDKYLYNSCYTLQSTLELIQKYVDNDFQLEPENVQKNEQLFWQKGNNCETLLNFINSDNI